MPSLETYRKYAKLLVRWHREGNYSVGEKLRLLERYRHLTDREILDMPMRLTLAQEIVAVEAGFGNWAALKAAPNRPSQPSGAEAAEPRLMAAIPSCSSAMSPWPRPSTRQSSVSGGIPSTATRHSMARFPATGCACISVMSASQISSNWRRGSRRSFLRRSR